MQKLESRLKRHLDEAVRLTQMDHDRLMKKPPDGKWSTYDCMEHMNLATELYLDQIEPRLDKLRPAKKGYKPTFIAKHLIRSMPPDKEGRIKLKMKTMKKLDPEASGRAIGPESLDRLKANIERLLAIVDDLKDSDPRSFNVKTALGSVLKLYVGDAMMFVTAHNERHFKQIEDILEQVVDQG